jgi:CheY-like chemotaxis protein
MANVLLVDDDLDMLDTLAAVLRDGRHTVRVAKNGREGLERLAEEHPDLILCDVEMPVLSGPDMALEVFLHDAGLELIPIVLISGVHDLPSIARRVGTPYYVAKPFTAERLMSVVSRALAEETPPVPLAAPQR